jgi:molybdopterin biosynthesis enzyme
VSSYVSFEVFVRPALRTLLGLEPAVRPSCVARLGHPLSSPPGRTQVARGVATRHDDGWRVDPVWGQGSHFVLDLSRANALLLVPAEVTRLEVGDTVEMWLLDDDGGRMTS